MVATTSGKGLSILAWNLPPITRIARADVQKHVTDSEWQRIRVSMKGMSTSDKLTTLEEYWNTPRMIIGHTEREARRVRVINYLTALKRGGQLSNERIPTIQR